MHSGHHFECLLLNAFDSPNVYYSSGASVKRGKSISARLEQAYFGMKIVYRGCEFHPNRRQRRYACCQLNSLRRGWLSSVESGLLLGAGGFS
jgi:hypothetical protein